jgi:hypothetical protein
MVVRRGKPSWHSEDIVKLLEQSRYQVSRCHHADSGLAVVRGHAVPLHMVVFAPIAHVGMGKIPEDGAESPQPLDVEYHLVAGQRDDKEI